VADSSTLLGRARNGDVAAFESLLAPLVEPACQLAYAILRDWPESEDVCQDAAVKAWRAVTRLRDDTPSLRPWYLTIVANEARSRYRTRWWSLVRVPDLQVSAGEDELEYRAVLRMDLERAMRRLDDRARLILVLHFYLDLPLDEVATVLGLSASAVKARLYRAVHALRPALQEWKAV
jgi:RNA polymerase sigma-70 factor (ECF subfamily)